VGGFLWLWAPVAAYTAFIFWLSSAARPAPPLFTWPGGDKLLHMMEYAPLGSLLLRAFKRSLPRKKASVFPVIAGFLFARGVAAADEFYQGFISQRFSSAWDAAADGTGAALGQWVYARWARTA
jgi:VanZ family protein